ncbi:DUF503 domain-containing protein [uncultured Modestobacter sp.]|uniref:DUF503 domain-containing protein n=1 Tax=uncultured Modestobacter sp. TaxID=380048 RepID=UPI0034396796
MTWPLQESPSALLQGPAASPRVAGGRRVLIFTGTLTADLLLGDVHSLKEKRSVVRPIVAELRRRFAVAAAEVGDPDLHRRAQVGVATVAGQADQVTDVLDACERLLAERPEVTLLSTHRQLISDTD